MKVRSWMGVLGLGLLCSCGGRKSNGGGSGSSFVSTLKVILKSSDLGSLFSTQSVTTLDTSTTSCTMGVGSSTYSGVCFTPLNMKAQASQLGVGSSYGNDNGGARVLNFAAAPEGSGFDGPFGLIGLASFDFSTPAASGNKYSDDNFQDATSKIYFNKASIQVGTLEVKIKIPDANTNVTNKYWTIRYPFMDYDLAAATTSSGQTLENCLSSNQGALNQLTESHLYSAPSGFLRGDILVCQKSAATDTCGDSDFKWVSSGALVATRPSSPVRLSGSYATDAPTCSGDSSRPDLALSSFGFDVSLSSGFTMTKQEHVVSGTQSESGSGGERYYEYTHQGTCAVTSSTSGTCTGTESTGVYATFAVDFDLENSIFVNGTAGVDLSSSSEADLLANLDSILPKPVFVANKKTQEGSGDSSGVTATLSVTLSDSE